MELKPSTFTLRFFIDLLSLSFIRDNIHEWSALKSSQPALSPQICSNEQTKKLKKHPYQMFVSWLACIIENIMPYFLSSFFNFSPSVFFIKQFLAQHCSFCAGDYFFLRRKEISHNFLAPSNLAFLIETYTFSCKDNRRGRFRVARTLH